MWRTFIVFGALGLFGCINQVANAVNPPPPVGGGTMTCAQIVESCDSQCTQPLCLHGCTGNGTAEAQQQHAALLSCGENNSCTDEACIRASCPSEVDACQGPPPASISTDPVAPAS